MTTTSRRRFLSGTGAAVAAVALPPTPAATAATANLVRPGAPQYADLARGVNQRWIGAPGEVWVARTSNDVVAAVGSALRSGKRVAVRGGGHCFEDFTTSGISTLIDLSSMDDVGYDPARRAHFTGAGARLGDLYAELFKGWGVTVPGGSCPTVGVGGHISGGGYGPLNRLHGLSVDYLYAVEVVVADRGKACKVVATREPNDPNRELWWAHTGGGGGNFGVVTKYWFRDLPTPPAELLVATVIWPWAKLTEDDFVRLVRNYTRWFADRNEPGSPSAHVYAHLATFHSSGGAVALNVQLDGTLPNADKQLDDFLAALGAPGQTVERRRLPWLLGTQWSGFADRPTGKRIKGKSAMHRAALTERQARTLYRHLTRTDYTHPGSGALIAPYGGKVNAVAPGATASVHRDCAITVLYVSEWTDSAQDARHIEFQRALYRDVYVESGGVPADGAYVNYADVDLLAHNWQEMYYRDAYPRLRRVKSRWDPGNVFRHSMSIQPDGAR